MGAPPLPGGLISNMTQLDSAPRGGKAHRHHIIFYGPVKDSIYQVEEVAGSKIISSSGS